MEAQEHLWQYYTDLGKRRGTQAVRNSGRRGIKYAEAYQRVLSAGDERIVMRPERVVMRPNHSQDRPDPADVMRRSVSSASLRCTKRRAAPG